MNVTNVKIVMSATCVVVVLMIIPSIGLTIDAVDEKQGVMIDFGQYNVDWIPITFNTDETGMSAISRACNIKEYSIQFNYDGTSVTSINDFDNLITSVWGMYVLRDGGWKKIDDPSGYNVSGEKIISWARTSDTDSMMPAVDSTGFTYYSYADGGKSSDGSDLRIITLAPSVTETVAAVGGLDMIVATDRYSNYPDSLTKKQGSGEIVFVGGYSDPNYELIVSQNPDIVFLDGSVGEHVSVADKLRKSGVHCVMMYEVVTVNDLFKNLWIAASALGISSSGNTYINNLSSTISSICAIANLQNARGFIALSTNESPYVAGADTYADSILTSLGVKNIFGNQDSWVMVDKEAIFKCQPDIIIIIYEGNEIKTQKEYDNILRSLNSMWKDTPAFKNKCVYIFSGESADLLSRPGARLGAVFELLAKSMDPQSFIDRDYWDRAYKFFGDDYASFLKYQEEGLMT